MDSDEEAPFMQVKRSRPDSPTGAKSSDISKPATAKPTASPAPEQRDVKVKAEEKSPAPKPKSESKKAASATTAADKKAEKKDNGSSQKRDSSAVTAKKEDGEKRSDKKDDKKLADDDDDIPLDQLQKKPAKEKAAPAKRKAKSDEPKKRKAEEDVDIVGEGVVPAAASKPAGDTPKKSKKGDSEKEEKKKPRKKKKADEEKEKDDENGGEGGGGGEERGDDDDDDEEGEGDSKWWKQQGSADGKKWHTLVHNGVLFPAPYVPHGRPVIYDGEPIKLTPEQEEWATYYANYLETDHVKNKIFNKNFFEDWLKVLNPTKHKEPHVIKDFAKCDFSLIGKYLSEQKEAKKTRSKDQKEKEKKEKEAVQEKYGFAMVNNIREKVGNFKIEPPGLFLGRGAHPKTGKFKHRITPEDVTLNLSEDAPVPPTPIEGHKWKAIVHDNTVAWLAFWKENINGGTKYVWLSPGSRIKGESDMKKFETARKLKSKIKDIRSKYEEELGSSDLMVRQRATALWIIDHLALRVGNEKGEDTADTVGCCSLRFEHIKLKPPRTVKFDFLGKDSMPYKNTVEVDTRVWDNLKQFTEGKRPGSEIFDKLTTSALNQHLKNQMEGLTAKVFRTYNASFTLERELDKANIDPNDSVGEKLLAFNRANREVAILCNHQRSTPKKFDEQMGKLDEKIKELKADREKLTQHMKDIKSGKAVKSEEPESEESDEEDDKSDGGPTASATPGGGDESPAKKKDKKKKKALRMPDDPEKCKAAIDRIDKKIQAFEFKKTEKDELKTVALGTSKINYIDPRITAAWCKRMNVPIEKVFTKALREKFPWALEVPKNWRF